MSDNIDALFAQTLLGEYDDDKPWEAVSKLRALGTREVFEIAREWCKSHEAKKRARAAAVLGQLGVNVNIPHSFPEESYEALILLLKHETEVQPLSSAIIALGQIGNPQAVPLITKYTAHEDCEIRFAVAYSLGQLNEDPEGIRNLIILMQDKDDDVRDWATFGLGVLGDADSDEIRQALILRLDDTFEDARMEAMEGLAKRKDLRVLPILMGILHNPPVLAGYIDAALYLLDMKSDPEEWMCKDYVRALKEKYPDLA